MEITKFSPKESHSQFFCLSTAFVENKKDYQLIAAPGSGVALHLTDIVVSAGLGGNTITFTEAPTGTRTSILDTIVVLARETRRVNLSVPLKMTDNSSLRLTSTNDTDHTVIVSGYIV